MTDLTGSHFFDKQMRLEPIRVLLHLIFPLIVLSAVFIYFTHDLYALSPLVPFQEYRDEPLDWLDGKNNFSRVITGLPSTDLFAVNYFTDGQSLNATLWLTNPFRFNTSADRGQINYGMLIDADSDLETGLNGIDYQIEISGENGTWTKYLRQYLVIGRV